MPNYARFDGLDEFAQFYREEIVPSLRKDPTFDADPQRKTPTYRWLKGNYSGFVERLRRDHDLSPGEFYDAVGLPESPDQDDDPGGSGTNRPSSPLRITWRNWSATADGRRRPSAHGALA